MRTEFFLLVSLMVSAQDPLPIREMALDLQTDLGVDSVVKIHLVPRGCWDGLILGISRRPAPRATRQAGEATVEVWDLLPPSSPRQEAFDLFLVSLRESLSKALVLPLPKNQAIELREIMASDPSNPQELDLTKVKSMQERFNRLPPNGSLVK